MTAENDLAWEMPPTGIPRAAPSPRARAESMGLQYGVHPPMTDSEYE